MNFNEMLWKHSAFRRRIPPAVHMHTTHLTYTKSFTHIIRFCMHTGAEGGLLSTYAAPVSEQTECLSESRLHVASLNAQQLLTGDGTRVRGHVRVEVTDNLLTFVHHNDR